MGFVHLRVQSHYSFLESTMVISEIANEQTIALTDTQFHGVFEFFNVMKKSGHKAIYGIIQTVQNATTAGTSRLLLIALNKEGFKELLELNSLANQNEDGGASQSDLRALSNVIAITGSMTSEVGQIASRFGDPTDALNHYHEIFGDNLYYEIQHHDLVEPWEMNCTQYGLIQNIVPLVLTNGCVYAKPDDARYLSVLIASKNKEDFYREQVVHEYGNEFYLKSEDEMQLVADNIELTYVRGERAHQAFHETAIIASKIEEIDLSVSGYYIPETPNGNELFKKKVYEAVPKRYPNANKTVMDRINYELSVMEKMDFMAYFLILQDMIDFANERGITTGPGRGSAAGSAVLYALDVTDVEPIRYRLIFERFLNPERISMPDVDLDFDATRRSEIIEFLVNRFGSDKVAQIATFSELGGRSAYQMVGSAFGIPVYERERVSKLIRVPAVGPTIKASLASDMEFVAEYNSNAQTKMIADIAMFFENREEKDGKIHGIYKNTGTHPGGVVISSVPLRGMVPTMKGDTLNEAVAIDMDMVEKRGLIKFDILGLKLLSAMRTCVDRIDRPDIQSIKDIPMDDPKVYEYIASGQTSALFQLARAGQICKDMNVSSVEDVIAINGLNRPGPKDEIPNYVARKQGHERVNVFHESLRPILEYTYGIIIYQEQIMQIAQVMCGYSLGEADLLRRAVGKKKAEILIAERGKFVQRAVQNGYDESLANEIYDLIVKFADYGFNRSHAAAYAILGYRTAWFKLYYPVIYMASMLESHSSDSEDSISSPDLLRSEVKRMGIALLPPDINDSGVSYTPNEQEKTIRYGLGSIKGVGIKSADLVVSRSPYMNLRDAISRCGGNKTTIEGLAFSGALDRFSERALLIPSLQNEIQLSKYDYTVFDFIEDEHDYQPLSLMDILRLEKNTLGTYVSGHPIEYFQDEWKAHKGVALSSAPSSGYFRACGILTAYKEAISKKKNRYAVGVVEDGNSQLDILLFSKVIESVGYPLESMTGSFVVCEGHIEEDKLRVNKIFCVSKARITTQRIIEDSPVIRQALKYAKRGTTEVFLASASGMEKMGQFAWTDVLDSACVGLKVRKMDVDN